MPSRHALIVGIDQYRDGISRLRGCVNDAAAFRSLLIDPRIGFPPENLTLLLDDEATRERILDELEALTLRVAKDDVVVLFYAGHGSRIVDPEGNFDAIESLVPVDSGREERANRDIFDVEIDQWIQSVNQKTPYVTLIMDCCHSGSVTRDAFSERTRTASDDRRGSTAMFGSAGPPATWQLARTARDTRNQEATSRSGTHRWVAGRRAAVVLAACREDELASEMRFFDGDRVQRHGALTFHLLKALATRQTTVNWRQLFETFSPRLTRELPRQHPLLEGKVDELVFGRKKIPATGYVRVLAADADAVTLGGGAAHGVTLDSRWRICQPPDRAEDGIEDRNCATVRITHVTAIESRAVFEPVDRDVESTQPIAPGQRATLVEQAVDPSLRVAASDSVPADDLTRLRALTDTESLLLWSSERDEADVSVQFLPPHDAPNPGAPCSRVGAPTPAHWAAVGRDGSLATHLQSVGHREQDALGRLVSDLVGVARFRNLLTLENPDPGSALRGMVDLAVVYFDPHASSEDGARAVQQQASLRHGDCVDMLLTNRAASTVHVTLVELGVDHRISILMPYSGHPRYQVGGQVGAQYGGHPLLPGQSISVRDYFLEDPKLTPHVRKGLALRLPDAFPWNAFPRNAEPVAEDASGQLHIKLLVTPGPADFSFMCQPNTRVEPHHPLQKIALAYAWGRSKRSFAPADTNQEPDADWATVTFSIAVTR